MSVNLVTTRVWPIITAAAKSSQRPAHVAVAYFGQGAGALLPLPNGSRLVVDASDLAVKSGQTCPAELAKLVRKGVRVFSAPNLHAKLFVFGRVAYVGSANVSRHSAGNLIEAVVAFADPAAVFRARDFVRKLCVQELGPETLARLRKLYRPPRFPLPRIRRRAKAKRGPSVETPPLWIAQLIRRDPPIGSDTVIEEGRRVAKKRMESPRRHKLDDFWWKGKCLLEPGDLAMQVIDEGRGRRMVSPPGTVVHVRRWGNAHKKLSFVYIELPNRRRLLLKRLARRLGRGTQKLLKRNGPASREFSARLLTAWND